MERYGKGTKIVSLHSGSWIQSGFLEIVVLKWTFTLR